MPELHLGLLTPDLTHNHGWAHYSLSLLLALRRAGVRVTVIAARSSPEIDGITVHRLLPDLVPAEGGTLRKLAQATPSVAHLLRECTVLHATAEPYAPLLGWIARGRPGWVTAHGSYIHLLPRRRWPVGALYRRTFQRARLVCVSRYTAQIAQHELPGVQTVVVNNGIDADKFAHLPSLDAPKHGPTILSVGAVKPRKGTLELVRALAVVRQHIPDVQGVIIGSLDAMPDYSAAVRAAVVELGLQDHVHLLGHVPEAVKLGWYGAADVFAMPSLNIDGRFEGYGLAHAEASAAGLPVIGTTDCGAADAIEDGVTGLLVSQQRVAEELPAAILRLLNDAPLRAQMGAAGRQRMQAQTWDHVAAHMIALYNQASTQGETA